MIGSATDDYSLVQLLDIRPDLERCDALVTAYRAAAVQVLGQDAIDVIDLPPLGSQSLEPQAIQVAAVTYWTGQVEQAGLPRFVEVLADKVVRGRLILPITTGGSRLMRYWRQRHERLAYAETRSL